jgi:hypothetical protein
MHYFFPLYRVTTPPHVTSPFIVHHQEAECIMWRMLAGLDPGSRQGRPLGGASGALAPGADFEGAPKKAVTDRPHVNTYHCSMVISSFANEKSHKGMFLSFGAGGNPAYRTSAFEAVCTLTPVFSSPIHLQRRSTPDGARDLC